MTPSSDIDSPQAASSAPSASLFGDAPSQVGKPMAYQVLARKYRPRRFEDLIGQEAMVRTLRNAFATGRIAHAFMLTGVRGIGKTTTARLLARALNYQSDRLNAPSIELDPPGFYCSAIIAGQHPDVLEMDAASHTGVANIRDILEGVAFSPVQLRKKIYIIDEVHMLSMAAFNSLLKTLEEPPAHVAFIFATTEIRKVPVTILSRCQRFDLRRTSPEALAAHLHNIATREGASIEADALALLARAAEGSVRDGLSLLDQAIVQAEVGHNIGEALVRDMLGLADRARLLDLFSHILQGDAGAALAELGAQYAQGAEPQQCIRDLMEICHLSAKSGAVGKAVLMTGPSDQAKRIREFGATQSPAALGRLWQVLLRGLEECQRAPDALAAAEMTVLRLIAAAQLPGPEEAAALLRQAAQANRSGSGEEAPAPTQSASSNEGAQNSGQKSGTVTPLPPSPSQRAMRPVLVSSSPEPVPVPEPVPSPAGLSLNSTETPDPLTFPDPDPRFVRLIDQLEEARELNLAVALERYARGAILREGRLEFALAAGAPRDFARQIETILQEALNLRVRVQLDATRVGETLSERRDRLARERIARARAHPAVAAILDSFPGATITQVDEVQHGQADAPGAQGRQTAPGFASPDFTSPAFTGPAFTGPDFADDEPMDADWEAFEESEEEDPPPASPFGALTDAPAVETPGAVANRPERKRSNRAKK